MTPGQLGRLIVGRPKRSKTLYIKRSRYRGKFEDFKVWNSKIQRLTLAAKVWQFNL